MTLDQIIGDLRRQIVDRKLRMKDFIQEYDRLKTGRVSRHNFHRALGAAGINISENNAARLTDAFKAPYGDDVEYSKFHDKIEEVFTPKGLERDPARKVGQLTGITGRFNLGLHVNSEPQFDSLADGVLRDARKMASNRSFVVSDPFRQFDKLNRGKITAQQFMRVLSLSFGLVVSDDVENALMARFGFDGLMDYRRFCDAVGYSNKTSPRHMSKPRPAGTVRNRTSAGPSRSVDENLDLIYQTILDRKVDVKDSLQDYDKLRRGYVTASQFASVLAASGLGAAFKAPDFDAMAGTFIEPSNGLVKYKQFLEAIGRKRLTFAKSFAESSSANTPDSPGNNKTLLLHSILSKINGAGAKSRHTMLDMFKDFDMHNNKHVSAAQFDRVLFGNGVLKRVNSKEVEYLHRNFVNPLRGGLINYQNFINGLNELTPSNVSVAAKAAQIRARTPPSRVDVQYLIACIKDRVKKLRIRVADFFYDYDLLRSGFITENLFSTALETARLQLTGAQMKELCKYYANAAGGRDARGEPFIEYSRFVEDLEAVFTKKGLEREPTTDVQNFTRTAAQVGNAPNDIVIDPQQRLSPDEEAALRTVLSRISAYVKRVQQDIVSPFNDFDRFRRGVVTLDQFKRATKKCLAFVSDSDVMLCIKAFQSPDANGDMGSLNVNANRARYVSYKWFIAAVDNVDGVLNNLPSATDLQMESIPNKGSGLVSTYTAHKNRIAPVDNIDSNVNADDVLHKLAKLQVKLRKQVSTFFEQYDSLRKGTITMAKFQCSLDNAGFNLTRSEQQALESKYKHFDSRRGDLVQYRNLLRDLRNTTPDSGRGIAAETMALAVKSTVAKLAHIVKQRRIGCKNDFLARDRQNEGTVSPSQFRGVLVSLGLKAQISDHALETLDKAFRSKQDPNRVDYKSFLSMVDP
jgi:Ca2+-binding EF-hand superfamily protein